MSSIQDLIKAKRKNMEAKKSQNMKTHKPAMGKNKYRILPAWRKANAAEVAEGYPAPFFHDFGMHWIKGEKGGKPIAVYVCAEKTFGRECDICGVIDPAIISAPDGEHKDLLKESRSRQTYLLNALHVNGQDRTTPVLMEVGAIIFEGICEQIEEYGDITDLETGTDVIINRTGSGFDTKYSVLPAKNSDPVPVSVMEKVHDLDAICEQENATKAKAAMLAIGKVTGVIPAGLPSTAQKKVFDDSLVEDAEFEEMAAAEEDEMDKAMNAKSKEKVVASDPDLDDDIDLDSELDSLLEAG